jgi:hypothetical protein
MQTHDQAVEFFTSLGVSASRRVWALGDTVVLPIKPQEPGPSGIVVYAFVAWLVPAGNGWDLVHDVKQRSHHRHFLSLEDACAAARELLALQDYTDACPDCGGERGVSFGERSRSGRLHWYVSTACRSCSAHSEADGADSLPGDLRSVALARDGTWAVFVEPQQTPSGWKTIREALRIDVSALAKLRQRLPAPLLLGTIGEADALAERLSLGGVRADVRQQPG